MTVYALDGVAPRVAETAWVAPTASVMGNVELKAGASVWFGATIRGDQKNTITVGERTNIQDGSVLHSDEGVPLTIGADVTVGHMAMLHGCVIGDRSLVGIGATILNNAVIGENCLIGAHALIPEGKVIAPERTRALVNAVWACERARVHEHSAPRAPHTHRTRTARSFDAVCTA